MDQRTKQSRSSSSPIARPLVDHNEYVPEDRPGYVISRRFRSAGALAGTSLRSYKGEDFNLSYTHATSERRYRENVHKWLSDFEGQALYTRNRVIFLHLVHGARIVEVTEEFLKQYDSGSFVQNCDGLVTPLSGDNAVMLTVKTADCLPVFLFDKASRASGIVHCGWRGLKRGVLSNGIEAMRAYGPTEDLVVHIGPGISADRYEVGDDVAMLFPESAREEDGKCFLDLSDAASRQALAAGIKGEQISRSRYCTYESADLFFSHRREGPGGSMLSFITVA